MLLTHLTTHGTVATAKVTRSKTSAPGPEGERLWSKGMKLGTVQRRRQSLTIPGGSRTSAVFPGGGAGQHDFWKLHSRLGRRRDTGDAEVSVKGGRTVGRCVLPSLHHGSEVLHRPSPRRRPYRLLSRRNWERSCRGAQALPETGNLRVY